MNAHAVDLHHRPAGSAQIVGGPYDPSPTVRWCDPGGHRLRRGGRWWMVRDTEQGWEANRGAACEYHGPGRVGLPADELAAYRALRGRLPGWRHTMRRPAEAPDAWQHIWHVPTGDDRRIVLTFVGLVAIRDQHGREAELDPADGPWYSVAEIERVLAATGVISEAQP